MSIRNLIFGVNSVTVSDLIRYDSLLQNATDAITKCDNYFITKRDRSLLQCDSFITKSDVYYKLRQYTILHGQLMKFLLSHFMSFLLCILK